MALKAGIIGLPNVGKSTLFNAITKKNILAANYPFATIDPNVGIVTLPDKRLETLNDMYMPERLIATQYEFIDIAGLVKGASNGEGLGNKFLSNIREVDAIVEVVRCFENKDIIHVEGNIDPVRDIEIINYELILSDLEIVENRLLKIEKKATTTNDKEGLFEVSVLKKAKEYLSSGTMLRLVEFDEKESKLLKTYNLITNKPFIYLANVSEDELLNNGNEYVDKVRQIANEQKSSVVMMCAKIESELSELEEEAKREFLKDLGINNSGLDQLIHITYHMLGLKTFFTVGSDEVRAWTFKDGMKAPECAGIIHTDFERGFIKAEVMSYDDLIKYGSELKVKEAGKARLEGKEYLMQDGDICYFRFNVTK
ncbi:MAG: redox-regulated ATPase YchF [Bacilli bacterium]